MTTPIHRQKKKSVTGAPALGGLNRPAREPIADGLPGHTKYLRDLGISTAFFTCTWRPEKHL